MDDKSKSKSTRARTLERRRERQKQQERDQQRNLLIGAGVVAVLLIVVIVIVSRPADAPIPDAARARYAGLPTSKTPEGFPLLGNPDAKVRVQEYSSFGCPACRTFHDLTIDGLVQRVRSGDIAFVYVPMFSTGGMTNREGAARAAACVAEQAIEGGSAFWIYHDMLFEWAGQYGNAAFTQQRMVSGVQSLGLDANAFNACLGSDLPGRVTTAAEQAARNLSGFTGTPTITVNGVIVQSDLTAINQAIDSALQLANSAPPTPTVQPTTQGTADVTPAATADATDAAPAVTADVTDVPASNTSVPASNTPRPATNTSVPPTNTSVPASNTPRPATNTSVPATATP